MNVSTFRSSTPLPPPSSLPTSIQQKASTTAQVLTLILLGPACVTLAMPLLMVMAHISSQPGALLALFDRPITPLLLALTAATWCLLFAWPVLRAIERLLSRRTVEIGRDRITVRDRSVLGEDIWSAPVDSYTGLVHLVRSSLSGVRHELLLAHERKDRCVVLAVAPRIDQSEIDRVAALLGVRELSSREYYGMKAEQAPVEAASTLSEVHA